MHLTSVFLTSVHTKRTPPPPPPKCQGAYLTDNTKTQFNLFLYLFKYLVTILFYTHTIENYYRHI